MKFDISKKKRKERDYLSKLVGLLMDVVSATRPTTGLMLWSSSGIWEVRKEIGLAQPRWSKKLGGLRYTE